MKKTIWLWQLIGFVTTSLGGTLLHFLYDWTGKAIWIAPFSGVNESTWEHMKLLFFPMFIFAIIESFVFKQRKDFWYIKLYGTLLGLGLIPIIFYTYNGVIGSSPDYINIAIFFISTAITFIYESQLFVTENIRCTSQKCYFILLCIIAVLFIFFTFKTPEIGIFKDPLTGTYGI